MVDSLHKLQYSSFSFVHVFCSLCYFDGTNDVLAFLFIKSTNPGSTTGSRVRIAAEVINTQDGIGYVRGYTCEVYVHRITTL